MPHFAFTRTNRKYTTVYSNFLFEKRNVGTDGKLTLSPEITCLIYVQYDAVSALPRLDLG